MVFLKSNNKLLWTLHSLCKQLILMIYITGLTMMSPTVRAQLVRPTALAPPVDGDVRLSGGRNALEGRVEIYFDGRWGTICDDDWGIEEADVVCRQLGYNMASRSSLYGLSCCLSFGPGFGPIHLDNMACTGDEESLLNCPLNAWGRHNCGHWEDAGVVCANPIRLKDGLTSLDGRVEVFINGQWGTICNTNWDIQNSRVVCKMLGGFLAENYARTIVPGEGVVHLDRVSCNGTEYSLDQCSKVFGSNVNVGCRDHSHDVGVNCTRYIRLVNGSNPLEGRLEIRKNERWGTVCDDQFSTTEAEVVCHQLGNYVAYPLKSHSCCARFGEGTGLIAMSELSCTGQERKIEQCYFEEVFHSCDHRDDVSVHCTDLRLIDQGGLRGKLMYIEDQKWGEICADTWDINAANVACRQLFNTKAIRVYNTNTNSRLQRSLLYGGFKCNGAESRLADCPRALYETCTGQQLAGVECEELIKIRLKDGSNKLEGRVEVFYDNEWGSVCDDGWSIEEAAVVCRQLGNFDVRSATCCLRYDGLDHKVHLDDVYCHGNEDRLEECAHSPWGEHNCVFREDAGVVCSDLRIPSGEINQATSTVGPVKLLVNGVWGNICAEDLSPEAASVICRQVHNTSLISIRSYESLAIPRISHLDCNGDELLISNCSQGVWLNTSCPSSNIGGVSCKEENKIRLVGGSTQFEGRVEINHDGEWGTICDDYFLKAEADVVCRQLGYYSADPEDCCRKFDAGKGPIWLDNVSCTGVETSIEECRHLGWSSNNCGHHEDVGVVCINQYTPDTDEETSGESSVTTPPVTIRLKGSISSLSGRVEVMKNGVFGTVCDDEFGIEEATVVCRQLGFPAADPYSCCPSFGGGRGPIHLDGLQCVGTEENLFQCVHTDRHNCHHFEDAGVNCLSEMPVQRPGIAGDGDLRLSDGDMLQGRVEIFHDGHWGTVCDDNFDVKDADVICRQLGFKSANPEECCLSFGAGVGEILLDDLECEGRETHILDCPHTTSNKHNCGHFEDVGVKCIRSVRLNSTENFEGLLELQKDDGWVAVCSEHFTLFDGEVACLHVGGLDYLDFEYRELSTTEIHAVELLCTGTESSLDDCNIGFLNISCKEVYLRCKKRSGTPLRLVNGKNHLEGRVEIFNKGQWGTICDDEWGEAEAVVGCRQLGNYEPVRFRNPAPCCGAFGMGLLPILLDNVVCSGTEQSLDQCSHGGWSVNNCLHFEDAGLICTDIRLVEGETGSALEGRVEILQNRKWLSIESANWTKENSEVFCRQIFNTTVASVFEYEQSGSLSIVTGINCDGNEEMLSSCQNSSIELRPEGAKVVGVACSEMRLTDGSSSNEGRIELISSDGFWSSICSHGFTQPSADVACRQAGFCKASDVYHDRFGPAPGNIRLAELKCTGMESKLQDCPYEVGGFQCSNSYFIAGVRCKETCDYPGSLLNGNVSPDLESYPIGSNVTLTCNEGYKLNGSSALLCERCAWNTDMPICEIYIAPCEDPPKFKNSKVVVRSNVVHYECLAGYHSNKVATYMVCNSGNWSGPGINCEDVENVLKKNNNDTEPNGSKSSPVVINNNKESHSMIWLMTCLLLIILILLVIYDIRKRTYRLHCKPVHFNCADAKDNDGELQLLSHDVANQQHESALQEEDITDNSWPA